MSALPTDAARCAMGALQTQSEFMLAFDVRAYSPLAEASQLLVVGHYPHIRPGVYMLAGERRLRVQYLPAHFNVSSYSCRRSQSELMISLSI